MRINKMIGSMMFGAAALAVAGPLAPAFASGGGHTTTCVVTSSTTYTGITKPTVFAADDAGSVVLKPAAAPATDGLTVGRVTANAGWSKGVEIRTGPKVSVQFRKGGVKKEFEAAQSAQYYGADVLVVEIKTCT